MTVSASMVQGSAWHSRRSQLGLDAKEDFICVGAPTAVMVARGTTLNLVRPACICILAAQVFLTARWQGSRQFCSARAEYSCLHFSRAPCIAYEVLPQTRATNDSSTRCAD